MTSTRNKWAVMVPVALGVFLATLDSSIVNMALPILSRDLNADFAWVQWVVLAYLMTVTCLMLTIGRLADMIGKKPLYLAGLIIFTLGSVLCGLSNSIALLIACRIVQGIGAAMLMALSAAIVTEAFPIEQRGKALGIIGMVVSMGIITGPTLGGLLLGWLSWHWIFFVNLPLGILAVVLCIRLIPATPAPGGQHFDGPGALLLFFALLSLLLGLTRAQHLGFMHYQAWGLLLLFLGLLTLFLVQETRIPHPMIDLVLFRNALFRVNLITGFLAFVCSAGTFVLMPFYLENVRAFSPQTTGLMLATVPLCVAIIAPWAGTLSDRFGTRPLAALGLGLQVVGYLGICTLRIDTSILGYILRFVPIGLGFGFFQSPNNSAIMGAVPRERLGVASGLLSITRTLGQIFGIAILGAVWAARQQIHLQRTSSDIPSAAIQVMALNDTVFVIIAIMLTAFGLTLRIWWKTRLL